MPGSDRINPARFIAVAICFFFSGFAALLYQTVWLRQFGIYFGTSDQALSVVLGAYMGGLALGAALASKYVSRITRPVLVYALLELGIAVGALLVPLVFIGTRSIYLMIFGGQAELPDAGDWGQISFYLVAAFAAIMIPTTLMGATLPVLIREVVRNDDEVGGGVGILYVANTAGAVGGTVVAAFGLLPQIGMQQTVMVGIVANVLVFLVAMIFLRQPSSAASGSIATKPRATKTPSLANENGDNRDWILPIILLSGAVSFGYEVLCTRMLGHVVGSSVYAFATMLASFLTGITIGGAIASRFAKTRDQATQSFVIAELGAAAGGLLMFHAVNYFAELSLTRREPLSLWMSVSVSMAVMLPVATFIGATFPLAIRILATDERSAAAASGRVFAWNTVGAIGGSLVTALFILPLMHYVGTTKIVVGANVILAIAVALVSRQRSPAMLAAVITIVGLVFAFPPTFPMSLFFASSMGGAVTGGPVLFSQVGRSATVSVNEDNGNYLLRTNGLPEAGVRLPGTVFQVDHEPVWLTALPAVLRPQAESMLVVGLGGGTALEHISPNVKAVDVIELEPVVLQVNRQFADSRKQDPLRDRRVNVILNDARSALALTSKRYDVIVSQPSHPWTAGASHLYSQEFAELAKQHLEPGGVFLQWIDMGFVDDSLLRSMGATLMETFPQVRLYRPTRTTLLFVASDELMQPEIQQATKQNVFVHASDYYDALGLRSVESLIAILAVDQPSLQKMCEGARLINDNHNLLAMRGPIVGRIKVASSTSDLLRKWHPLNSPVSPIPGAIANLDEGWIVRRRNFILRGEGVKLAAAIDSEPERNEFLGWHHYRVGDTAKALDYLRQAIALRPDSQDAIFMLTQLTTGTEHQGWLSKLAEPHRTVALAAEFSQRNDWAGVERSDAALATLLPRDFCFLSAAQLRVEWRLRDRSPRAAQRSEEALEIIDDQMPYSREANTMALRTIAAMVCRQPIEAIGSCELIYAMLSPDAEISADDADSTIAAASEQILRNCLMTLNKIGENPQYQGYRLFAIQRNIGSLIESCEKKKKRSKR